jgi:hypothetical protein
VGVQETLVHVSYACMRWAGRRRRVRFVCMHHARRMIDNLQSECAKIPVPNCWQTMRSPVVAGTHVLNRFGKIKSKPFELLYCSMRNFAALPYNTRDIPD